MHQSSIKILDVKLMLNVPNGCLKKKIAQLRSSSLILLDGSQNLRQIGNAGWNKLNVYFPCLMFHYCLQGFHVSATFLSFRKAFRPFSFRCSLINSIRTACSRVSRVDIHP